MAPPAFLYKLVFGGQLFTTESWSCSLHVASTTQLALSAVAFKPALVAYVADSLNGFSSAANLDLIKFNQVSLDKGRYVNPVTNEHLEDVMTKGNIEPAPGQVSLVISLRTNLARGRAHAGRFYVPAGAMTISTVDGTIPVAKQLSASDGAATMINKINVLAKPHEGGVVVWSQVGQTAEPVTSVRVGAILDTMRSRRRSLDEAYVSSPVVI